MAELNIVEKVIALEAVELLQNLTPEQLARIASIAREVRFAPDREVLEPGKPLDALYVIVDGAVELSRNGEVLHTARQNDVLGAWALFDQDPMPVAATNGRGHPPAAHRPRRFLRPALRQRGDHRRHLLHPREAVPEAGGANDGDPRERNRTAPRRSGSAEAAVDRGAPDGVDRAPAGGRGARDQHSHRLHLLQQRSHPAFARDAVRACSRSRRNPALDKARKILETLHSLAAVDKIACERISSVIRGLKTFARVDSSECREGRP